MSLKNFLAEYRHDQSVSDGLMAYITVVLKHGAVTHHWDMIPCEVFIKEHRANSKMMMMKMMMMSVLNKLEKIQNTYTLDVCFKSQLNTNQQSTEAKLIKVNESFTQDQR